MDGVQRKRCLKKKLKKQDKHLLKNKKMSHLILTFKKIKKYKKRYEKNEKKFLTKCTKKCYYKQADSYMSSKKR